MRAPAQAPASAAAVRLPFAVALPASAVAGGVRAAAVAAQAQKSAAAAVAAVQLERAVQAIGGAAVSGLSVETVSAQAFDNKTAAPAYVVPPAANAKPSPLPTYLAASDPESAEWLGAVIARMRKSRTARAVLRKVEALAAQRGRPLVVVVAPLQGASGLYNYDTGLVTVDSRHRDEQDLDMVAGVFTHELQHAVQFGVDLPMMAFEMEVESFLVEFRVQEELGYKRPAGSIDRSGFRRFKNDPERFIAWLNREYYPTDLAIIGKGAGEFEDRLLAARKSVERGLAWHERRLKKVLVVLERMKETGQPENAIEQYRLDEVLPIESSVRMKRRELGWLDHDLAIMRDPVARARYEKYAAGVLRRARAYHKKLNS